MSCSGIFDEPPVAAAGPLAIAERCWLVGNRNPASLLQCNTYVRIFPGPRHGTSICIDPGSQFDAAAIESNIRDLTGSSGLSAITVNHQDPDVTGNLPALCNSNPDATVMMTEDTWRLVQHLLVSPGKLEFPPAFSSRPLILRGGIAWQPVPTPFCHFRGAMAFYDPESQILFSGDLFGGLNRIGRVQVFADETDWGGIAQFHQIYMPSREILRHAIRQIRALTPPVKFIAPQHGYVIRGELVPLFLERMEQLLVGHDLFAVELDDLYGRQYRELIALMIQQATAAVGEAHVAGWLKKRVWQDDVELERDSRSEQWYVRSPPYTASARVFRRLTSDKGPLFVNSLRDSVLHFCCENNIPVPAIGWGMEGGLEALAPRPPARPKS